MTSPAITLSSGWQPATAVYTDQRLLFPGELTPAPGLVIIPAVNSFDCRYTGGWSILHAGSGQHVGPRSVPLAYAREAAHLLSQLAVDWTNTAAHLRTIPGLSSQVWDIHTRVHEAWSAGTPTWFARHSWQHIRPAWLVTTVDTSDGVYQIDTWPDLVAWLTKHGDHPWYAVEGITRESDGTWRLTCAAPLCGNHIETTGRPAVLADEDDHTGGSVELRHYDRGDVANDARALGWTRHDQRHWTCLTCSAEHAANPDREYGGC